MPIGLGDGRSTCSAVARAVEARAAERAGGEDALHLVDADVQLVGELLGERVALGLLGRLVRGAPLRQRGGDVGRALAELLGARGGQRGVVPGGAVARVVVAPAAVGADLGQRGGEGRLV